MSTQTLVFFANLIQITTTRGSSSKVCRSIVVTS